MIPIIEVSKVFTKTLISFDQIFTKPIEVYGKNNLICPYMILLNM